MFSHLDPALFCRKRITIVVPDSTRSLDYSTTLKPLVAFLLEQEAEVNFYVALGLHRPMSIDELRTLHEISDPIGAKIKQHRPQSGALEKVKSGVAFHRRYIIGVDLIINVGVVEPHQYAGFSGGVKGLAIGCADAISIARMHHISHLKNPKVGVGKLDDNIFHENLWAAVEGLPDIYGLFMVAGTPSVFFDKVEKSFFEAVALARKTHFKTIDKCVGWMEVSVPDSKSKNFYQASRAATYVALVDNSALKFGGHILLNATCPEKMGAGEGEKACANIMKKGKDALLEMLEKSTAATPSLGGEQRAYVIAMALEGCEISVIGAPEMRELKSMGIQQFATIEEAKSQLNLKVLDGIKVSNPFHEIPVLTGPNRGRGIPQH